MFEIPGYALKRGRKPKRLKFPAQAQEDRRPPCIEIVTAHRGPGERIYPFDHVLIKIFDWDVSVFVLQKQTHGHVVDPPLEWLLEQEEFASGQTVKPDCQFVVAVFEGGA